MANLWHISNDDTWAPAELSSAAVLSRDSIEFVDQIDLNAHHGEVLLYAHEIDSRQATWLLLAPARSQVRVNDTLLESGIRALVDRDAIRVPGVATMYYSTERLARVEPFVGPEQVFCARCRLAISAGDPSVTCPRCGVVQHEQGPEGRNCFTYAETCSLCDQPTDLESAGYQWTPEDL